MLTDWLIIRRLAAELDQTLRGQRIRDVGSLPDGRFGLLTAAGTVAFDPFGATPLVTLDPNAELARGTGWVPAAARTLEGLRIASVHARPGDRLIVFECAARSRFGVASAYRLIAELVPRFGNLVLLKDQTVIVSAKSFRGGEASRRIVTAGEIYEPPPLRPNAERQVPRLVEESLAIERRRGGSEVRGMVERLMAPDGPAELTRLYAYHDEERLLQVHLVPLLQFDQPAQRPPKLLAIFSEFAGRERTGERARSLESRRAALAKRIEGRRERLERERATLQGQVEEAEARERLRRAGDVLYAHVHEIPARAKRFVAPEDSTFVIELDPQLDAKANAAQFFKRYKKMGARLDHLGRRLAETSDKIRYAGELAWGLDEARDAAGIDELTPEIERLEGRRLQHPEPRDRTRKSLARGRATSGAPQVRGHHFEVELASDARILVGRSPQNNADLTFRVARPNDLWFHARNVPGAHVILRIDGRRPPTATELERAASLAALHSRARESRKVDVDYTERKNVRKQRAAAPGLVWYTNARTLSVTPKEIAGSKDGTAS